MRKKTAFSLLETIVALALLSIIVVALLPMITVGLHNTHDSSESVRIAAYSQQVMEYYKSSYFEGAEIDIPLHPEYSYRIDTEELEDFHSVQVTVTGDKHAFTTRLLLPKQDLGFYTD